MFSSFFWLGGSVLQTIVAQPSNTAPAPVAMLIQARPKIETERGGTTNPARTLDMLRVGDRLHVGKGGEAIIVFYNSGKRWQIRAPSTFRITNHQPVVQTGVPPRPLPPVDRRVFRPIALAYGQNVPIGARFGGDIVRSDTDPGLSLTVAPTYLSPERVVLRWRARGGGPYTFRVQTAQGRTVAEQSGNGDGVPRPFRVPSALLSPGQTYGLRVRDGRGQIVQTRTFRVLNKTEKRDLLNLLRRTAPIENNGDHGVSSEVVAALLLESRGLWEEAYMRYADILRRDPQEQAMARWCRAYRP